MTRITQVDAFTSVPFRGNPAGVCVLTGPPDDAWMQSVATEMNLSETAFLWPEGSAFRLRWFTPSTEVDLCGHATLASAHVLWEQGWLETGETARFETRSGTLSAGAEDGWILLDFPAEPAQEQVGTSELARALGTEVRAAWRNRFDILAEVTSADAVRTLDPDLRAVAALGVRGVIATAPSNDDDVDFVSRFFGPSVGVDEDPVTGSAHCFLAAYWGERLGKSSMVGYQSSRRGGIVRVELKGDRVSIGGQAVTVLDGTLLG